MDNKKIGLYITSCRKKAGMSQKQLADALGVKNKEISRWETALAVPDISALEALSKALNVSFDSMINGGDSIHSQ